MDGDVGRNDGSGGIRKQNGLVVGNNYSWMVVDKKLQYQENMVDWNDGGDWIGFANDSGEQ